MQLAIPKIKTIDFRKFIQMYREPVVTFCITPNLSPELQPDRYSSRYRRRGKYIYDFDEDIYSDPQISDMLLNTISGLFSKFYAPERIRFQADGIKIKMNDVVSYKIAIINGEMKFYLTVPKKWSKSFIASVKRDWGEVDIVQIKEEFIKFNPTKTKAMEVHLRHHYALSIKNDDDEYDDTFYASIASLAQTLSDNDKLLIDFNIEPVNDFWKPKAQNTIKKFKNGKAPIREDLFTIPGFLGRIFDMFNIVFDEFTKMIEDMMNNDKKDESENKKEPFELKYSDKKLYADSKGYKMQIRTLCESDDEKRIKYALQNVETAFSSLDGDNKFAVTHIRTKRGIKSIIKAVENNSPQLLKTPDIYSDREIKNILKLPSKKTLKEYSKIIKHDNFTRTEIDKNFFDDKHGAIPFGKTLDKEPKRLHFGGYKREWWTEKGRYVKEKTKLDDRSTATLVFGGMGSGKTSASENQALYTFGAHIQDRERWKHESKSVVVFDVADGAMITNIYNHIPEWLQDRVILLNHANFNNPIGVNNADLAEFNKNIMRDEDYDYTLAEMEAKLVLEILESDKSLAMDRWFTSALQVVHEVNQDWGYIEAIRILIDDDFRQTQVMPFIKNRRLKLEMQTYNQMAMDGKAAKIIQTIENRFSQLERDQKLWDCIAQKPLRNDDGTTKLNFRKLMDGDENGAYMILIHIPKSGVSRLYRKFLFAHYFTKIWNVALSREAGFAGREYRPETLVIIDEIHQIIDIPLVGKLFIDLFKEPRKYSLRLWLTLHGWSSLSKAGRGLEGDIKQSILDNGCNLIMLKGGGDAFESLKDFLQPLSIADFNNLMNMDFCGIFRITWQNKNHVFQAKLLEPVDSNKDFKKHNKYDSRFLTTHNSPYGRPKQEVRDEILERSYQILENAIKNTFFDMDVEQLSDIKKDVAER